MIRLKVDNAQFVFNNVFIIEKLENVQAYKKKMKMKIKFINFQTSIDSFYRFSSKKSMNKNINNSRSKSQFLNFNNDLIKTLKKIFRNIYNDFDELSFFENSKSILSIIFHAQ